MSDPAKETWGSGGPYERYVGRWSRKIAVQFLDWLNISPGQTWADVGCGTGALLSAILARFEPKAIMAIDRSEGFITEAGRTTTDARVYLEVGDALHLPWPSGSCDVSVSGLVLNFVPSAQTMAKEMVRITRDGGQVGAYVWDYAGGMQMMRHFWDVAVALNPNDAALDQAERFPICQPEPLTNLFEQVGLTSVVVRSIEIPTVFKNFDDYWQPFLGKQGAAPTYLASLDDEHRNQIRDTLKTRLVPAADGSIAMTARTWAVKGLVADERPHV